MPGSCDAEIRPALERASGRRVGETLGLCYSPEFIALGSVIRDMLEPDMVLIGESDPRAGDVLERLYAGVCENDPPFRRMSLVNAELTKIAVNTYVTMKISYANALADMCERLPGADVEAVTDALGLDTQDRARSTCAERSRTAGRASRATTRHSACSPVTSVPSRCSPKQRTQSTSRRRIGSRASFSRGSKPGNAVGILGLAYKPDTGVIEESPGIALARLLGERRLRGPRLRPGRYGGRRSAPWAVSRRAASSAAELLAQSDVTVIATPWPEFAELPTRGARAGGTAHGRDRLLAAAPRRGERRTDRDRAAWPSARGGEPGMSEHGQHLADRPDSRERRRRIHRRLARALPAGERLHEPARDRHQAARRVVPGASTASTTESPTFARSRLAGTPSAASRTSTTSPATWAAWASSRRTGPPA